MSEVNQPVPTELPLHYLPDRGIREAISSKDMVVREAPLRGHLILRGNGEDQTLRKAMETVVGLALPLEPCTTTQNGDAGIYWLGPTEWLVIVAQDMKNGVEAGLRNALQGRGALVDVSGGQTLLNVSGSGFDTLLMKSSGYDFQSSRFGPGRCVQTTFARATALVSKRDDGSVDLIVRRSFADYLASWMLDAGAEFDCRFE